MFEGDSGRYNYVIDLFLVWIAVLIYIFVRIFFEGILLFIYVLNYVFRIDSS